MKADAIRAIIIACLPSSCKTTISHNSLMYHFIVSLDSKPALGQDWIDANIGKIKDSTFAGSGGVVAIIQAAEMVCRPLRR